MRPAFGPVIALLVSAAVGTALWLLVSMDTTPQWITGSRSFTPDSGGLELIRCLAQRDADSIVAPKNLSVLCVHGAWNSARVWDLGEHEKYFTEENNNFLEKFATDFGYNSYALSFRYHGKSDGIGDVSKAQHFIPSWIARRVTRIGDYVEDLRAAMEHVFRIDTKGNRLVLLCHDMGCFVTMKLLEKYGHRKSLMKRVAGIVMLSPIGPSGSYARTIRDVLLPNMTLLDAARALLTMDAVHMMACPRNTKQYFFPEEVSTEQAQRFHEKLVEPESLFALLDMTATQLVDVEKIRSGIKSLKLSAPLPVYVVFSENDKLIHRDEFMDTVRMFRAMGSDIVSTSFEQLMPNIEVAHHMMYGDKWKTVFGLIIDFLRKRAIRWDDP